MVLARLLLMLPFVVPPLWSYVDHNRVLLVFEAVPSAGQSRRQMQMLESHSAELKERDVIIVPGSESDELRAQFHVKTQFTVILIGKDGGEKLRRHTPIAFEQLAATIDAMPMRQEEMRRPK